jgi:hypothetical protein
MCTWLVELGFGLAGVLSTVTIAAPYEPTIAAQLIRLQKPLSKNHLLGRVNAALSGFRQFDIGFDAVFRCGILWPPILDRRPACRDFTAP